jgi:hypothetical protein
MAHFRQNFFETKFVLKWIYYEKCSDQSFRICHSEAADTGSGMLEQRARAETT